MIGTAWEIWNVKTTIYQWYKKFKKEEYKVDTKLHKDTNRFEDLLKGTEVLEKRISKYKTGIDLHQDYRDEDISSSLLEIKRLNQQMEDWVQEIKQTEGLLEYYDSKIDTVQDEIFETEDKIRKADREDKDINGLLYDIDYDIIEANRQLKPIEDKFIKQLNENTSLLTWSINKSLGQSYDTRLSRMSKKESVLTNGDLKGSKLGYKSSVISSRRSAKSKRSNQTSHHFCQNSKGNWAIF